jgi:hypothetical protein
MWSLVSALPTDVFFSSLALNSGKLLVLSVMKPAGTSSILLLLLVTLCFLPNARGQVKLTVGLRSNNVALVWPVTTPAMLLEHSTDLLSTNWETLYGATVSNAQYVVTASTTNAVGYYRLQQIVHKPFVPVVIGDPDNDPNTELPVTFSDDACGSEEGNGCLFGQVLVSDFPHIFTATNTVDPNRLPADPAPTYHWEIFFPLAEGGLKYTARGITGYLTPTLRIGPNCLPDIQGDLRDESAQWRVVLTIKHSSEDPFAPGQVETIYRFRFRYSGSPFNTGDCGYCQDPASAAQCPYDGLKPATEPC